MEKPTKEQFHAYQDVQQSGITNMFDVSNVIRISEKYYQIELTDEVCLYIMKNYSDLVKEYGDARNSKV